MNAPATFQRAMEECMKELNLSTCLIHLDNLICFSQNKDKHLDRLQAIFECLGHAGLKLKPKKCKLFQEEIMYLGHQISKMGIHLSDDNIEAIHNLKVPTTYTEIRNFVSCVAAYRRFI